MLRPTDEELLAQPGPGNVRLLPRIGAVFSVGRCAEGEGFEDPCRTPETRTWRAVRKHDWNLAVLEGVVTTFTTKNNCPICPAPGTPGQILPFKGLFCPPPPLTITVASLFKVQQEALVLPLPGDVCSYCLQVGAVKNGTFQPSEPERLISSVRLGEAGRRGLRPHTQILREPVQ